MVNSRRQFLFLVSCLLLKGKVAKAYPLDKVLGQPKQEYVQEYLRRYLAWYNKRWFKLTAAMGDKETRLFNYWQKHLTSFGQTIHNHYFENFLTRQHLIKDKIYHGRHYCGLTNWDDKGKSFLEEFIKSTAPKGLLANLPMDSVFGWSHDFDKDLIKLWFKNPQEGHFPISKKQVKATLGFVEFNSAKETRRGSVQCLNRSQTASNPLIDTRLILSSFKVTDSLGGVTWKYRTSGTFLPNLKEGSLWLATKHRLEFRQAPDFLEATKNEVKFYYP